MDELPPCIRNIGASSAPSCQPGDCLDHASKLACTRRTLQARQALFFEGDAQTHVYMVKSGAVSLYRMLRNGRRQVIAFKLPGEFVGLGYEAKHRCCAEAIGATEVRCFQTSMFHAAAMKDSCFLLKLYEAVAKDLSHTQEQALSVGQRDAEGSVAAFLLNVEARTIGAGRDESMSLPMSRADIADYLGLSLETVSRIFTGFKRMKLIEIKGRRGVKLIGRRALRALSDGAELSPPGQITRVLN